MRALVPLAVLAGCGDNLSPPDDILAKLEALPGVTAREVPTSTEGYRYYVLEFTQPVDHDHPGQTFQQEISLLHADIHAPMVVHTTGYWDYWTDHTTEPTVLLGANQITIEHRYFGSSRPDPADWSKLTIEQMADDEHAIVTALKTIYDGVYVATGASKGGMTATFYRRFFPDDVAATIAYVAPIMFAAPDPRFPPFLDVVGTDGCRAQVRAVATEMLAHRRAAMEAATMQQATDDNHTYTRILLGPAVENAIVSLEWSFWQYFGIDSCPKVPDVTADDATLFKFLDDVSPPSENDDEFVGLFDAFYFQSDFQLGFPDGGAAYLDSLLMYGDADYVNALPTAQPAYDGGAAMTDIASFVANQGDRLVFVYGQWDPWTAGKFALGNAVDSLELVEAEGTHGSNITHLAPDDEHTALAKLGMWTGVSLDSSIVPRIARTPPLVRIPPAMRRARR